ncbi:MAG TPA: ABC transporter substrate-binding protein [Candidatus Limnocylindrales bacterium]
MNSDFRAGNPPDIAVLPNLGLMQQLARQGKLVALNNVLDMSQVQADYAPAWLDLGSVDGSLYGIFYKVADKSTVWYDPAAFAAAHYEVPTDWDALGALADEMVADGKTPFSIAAGGGPANGWALTDWISEIVLNNCGAGQYDDWVAARIPWTEPCIRGFVRQVRQARDRGQLRARRDCGRADGLGFGGHVSPVHGSTDCIHGLHGVVCAGVHRVEVSR